jgi:hypothetical protein
MLEIRCKYYSVDSYVAGHLKFSSHVDQRTIGDIMVTTVLCFKVVAHVVMQHGGKAINGSHQFAGTLEKPINWFVTCMLYSHLLHASFRMFFLSFLLLLVPLVSSTSRRSMLRMHKAHVRSVDTAPITGQFDSVNVGQYSLLNDLWGEYDAASGSQKSQITSLTGDYIAWTTTYTWVGGGPDQVKSFANIQLNDGINQQLSAISSLPVSFSKPQTAEG